MHPTQRTCRCGSICQGNKSYNDSDDLGDGLVAGSQGGIAVRVRVEHNGGVAEEGSVGRHDARCEQAALPRSEQLEDRHGDAEDEGDGYDGFVLRAPRELPVQDPNDRERTREENAGYD